MLDDFKARSYQAKRKNKPPKIAATKQPEKSKEIKNMVDDSFEVPDNDDKSKTAKDKSDRKWWHILHWKHTHLSRPKWALLVVSLFLAILLAVFGAYKLFKHLTYQTPQQKQAAVKKKEPPKPTTEASHLTGIQVDPALNNRPVTGVMIENSPDARPQSGLTAAGVVFEAIAEGGITRFLALFQEAQPDYIGPVRSARPYYLDWALEFNASYAHVGGSPDALNLIKTLGVRDLDQFANGSYYDRVSSRYAPHNVYTSTAKLDALNQKKGYTGSTFTSWPRKAEKKVVTPTAKTIDLAVSGFLYSPHYDYDAATNTYLRSEGGQPHKDERSGAQIAPKVVIAMVTDYSIAGDGVHSVYSDLGSGHVFIFQDGSVNEGTWQKADHNSQIVFKDSNGNAITLNPGQTWLTMVASSGAVSYKP